MDHETLVGHLASMRSALLAEVERVAVPDFARRPAEGRWCVAEVLEHLANVEERVASLLSDVIAGRRTLRVSLFDRLRRLPPRLVASRRYRVRAPRIVEPRATPTREVALARLAASRTALLALLEEHRGHDVGRFLVTHAALGAQDLHGWAELIGFHEERHRRQITEIRSALQESPAA
jgi:GNAT superfamily N-acetyltransferase